MAWITRAEVQAIRVHSATPGQGFPGAIIPNLNLIGLCDTGWILSDNLEFAIAAFLFFGGTILAFYTSLGGIAQIAGYVMYFRVFHAAHADVVSDLPSAMGPKLALISILLVMTGLVFPIFIWSKVKLKSIWRRFITVTPEKNVRQAVPMVYAGAGSAAVFLGLVVNTSSVYDGGSLSAALFMLAGLILLGTAMFAIIIGWKTE